MNTEDREARLTAYALNDPGLPAETRQEIEAVLTSDPTARRAVEETRQLARLLIAGLAAEQAALPAEPAVVIPAPEKVMRTNRRWAKPVVAAAAVLIAVGGLYIGWKNWANHRENEHQQVAAYPAQPEGEPGFYGSVDYDGRHSNRSVLNSETRSARTAAVMGGVTVRNTGAAATGAAPGQVYLPATPPDPNAGPAPGLAGPGSGGPAGGGEGGSPGYPGLSAPVPTGPAGPGDLGTGPRPGVPGMRGRSGATSDRLLKPNAAGGYPAPATEDPVGLPDQPGETAPGQAVKDLKEADKAPQPAEPVGGDRFHGLVENPFTRVEGLNALSTFGVDVDTASYAIVRNYLNNGQLPPPSAVRLEEMVNYFPYADKPPQGDDPFAVTVEMAECPWQPAHRLVRLGLKAKPIADDKRPPSNLVFLIDVSGSMSASNKLPLVKAALKLLVGKLRETDRVAIVVYAGSTGLVLNSTSAAEKDKIVQALDRLEAGGSTNGAGGLQQAYEVAANHFIKKGTNRVILCTDGDWNVGITGTDALTKLIEEKRESGVFLSVFGFGMGNLRDEMMVRLANKGNGNYGYIDTLREAQKAFVEQMGGTLVTVAKDVKIQIEFNPAAVKAYRLLGYEKRILAAKDFHDDKKDAGEMGAGHVVTALYELVPAGAPDPIVGKVDGLRYQKAADPAPAPKAVKPDEAFVVKMRHKKPDGNTSTLRELPVKERSVGYEKASEDFQFAAAVASFAMLLKDSPYKGESNYGLVLELAKAATKNDPGGYRTEFVELVKKAKGLAGK